MRAKNIVLVVVVAAMINLPFLHGLYLNSKFENEGVDVTAQVDEARDSDGDYLLSFTVPGTEDRDEFSGVAQVDQETFADAERTGEVIVRLLPDNPGAYRVDGQVRNRMGIIITVLADLFLALSVLLLVKFRSRLKPVLVLLATEDLERCPPGSVLDRIEGEFYVVAGEIAKIEGDEVLLDLGDRRVRVVLDEHHNPAGYDQPVRATGRMIG